MVNSEIVSFIQTKINTILADLKNSESENYDARFLGFTCVIHNEINYKFKKAEKKKIEANCLFGSATKTNDPPSFHQRSSVRGCDRPSACQESPNGHRAKDRLPPRRAQSDREVQRPARSHCQRILPTPAGNPMRRTRMRRQVPHTMSAFPW